MTTTPLMGLILPDVSVTPGPLWASMLNAVLQIVDAHNHSPGSGAPIGVSGLDLQGDLTLNSNDATGLRTTRLTDQTSIVLTGSDIRSLYSKNGDLYYRNAALVEVQVTSGGTSGISSGNITSLTPPAAVTYSAGSSLFAFTAGPGLPAKLASSDIQLYAFPAGASPITLKAAAGTTTHDWTFPAAQATTNTVLGITTAGQVTYGVGAGAVGSPSLTFAADPNTGFYNTVDGEIGVTANGLMVADFHPDGFRAKQGTVSSPSIAFLTDPNTGFYNTVTDGEIGITTNGINVTTFHPDGIRIKQGTLGSPSLAFLSDPNTGLYNAADGSVSVSSNGINSATFHPDGIWTKSGNAPSPSYSFLTDIDTGLFTPGANRLSITVGGVAVAEALNSSGIKFKAISTTGAAYLGAVTSTSDEAGIFLSNSAEDWNFFVDSSGYLQWRANGVNYMTLNNAGQFLLPSISAGPATGYNLEWDLATGQIRRWSSSSRYKEDITDLDFDSSLIYDLEPVSFTMKGYGNRSFGLIAEQVFTKFPQITHVAPEDKVIPGGDPDLLIPDGVNYMLLSVLLLAELKKLKDRVDLLEG